MKIVRILGRDSGKNVVLLEDGSTLRLADSEMPGAEAPAKEVSTEPAKTATKPAPKAKTDKK